MVVVVAVRARLQLGANECGRHEAGREGDEVKGGLKRTAKYRRKARGTDFLLILLFSDESLGAASSEGGVGDADSFLVRAGAMGEKYNNNNKPGR